MRARFPCSQTFFRFVNMGTAERAAAQKRVPLLALSWRLSQTREPLPTADNPNRHPAGPLRTRLAPKARVAAA